MTYQHNKIYTNDMHTHLLECIVWSR